MTTPVSGRLWQSFQTHVDRSPDAIAIETTEGQLTFGEIANAAEKIRDSLANQGIGSGDIVHVALPNIPAFLPAVLASWQLGVTVGLVSSKYRDAEFRALASRVPPKAYITTRQLTRVLERSIDADSGHPVEDGGLGTHDLNIVLGTAPSSDGILDREGKPRLSLVKFTSGSTGAPKGVGLTEANLIAEGTNIVKTLGIERTDRIHVPVPVSHSYGFDLGLLPVIVAGASSLLRRSFVPREILQDLASPGTTVFLGVPSMYRVLAETDPAEVPDLSHVRYFLSCTAPLMPDLIHRCNERLRISVCQHYGSSESGAIATHRPAEVQRLPGSVGKAMAGVQVRIAGPQGDERPVGTEGEIVVRSAAVSPGYVTQELPSSKELFRSLNDEIGEYRTGDIGMIDAEGFIYWRGRRDEVINVGGLKVYPSEVVQILEKCPGVSGARVVAAKDHSGEEIVHAVVTLSQSMREQDILAFCRQHLADYKVPRRIEVVESISAPEVRKMSDLSEGS